VSANADLVSIPKTIGRPVGGPAWWPVFHRAGANSILFQCPNGHVSSLSRHGLATDGLVVPSIGCSRCDYHVTARLLNLDPRLAEERWPKEPQ